MVRKTALHAAAVFAAFLGLGISCGASAAPILNPDPLAFDEDVDGTGYFTPLGDTLFAQQFVDLSESLGLTGTVFGFFFQGADVSDSSNLNVIFGPDDFLTEEAVVNFINGIVVDVDQAAVQNTFAPASANIGFFAAFPAFGGTILFSDPNLNAGGSDEFGALPLLADPDSLGLFFVSSVNGATLSLTVAGALAPVVDVPGPAPILLMLLGAAALNSQRKLKRTGAA